MYSKLEKAFNLLRSVACSWQSYPRLKVWCQKFLNAIKCPWVKIEVRGK